MVTVKGGRYLLRGAMGEGAAGGGGDRADTVLRRAGTLENSERLQPRGRFKAVGNELL